MKKIKVLWTVNQDEGAITFNKDDLSENWDSLSDAEKETAIRKALDSMPEQPYMVADKYFEL